LKYLYNLSLRLVQTRSQHHSSHNNHDYLSNKCIYEYIEGYQVPLRNTLTRPRTVVVQVLHTHVTIVAVFDFVPLSRNYFAVAAVSFSMESFHFVEVGEGVDRWVSGA
jgi:hypothetical protein